MKMKIITAMLAILISGTMAFAQTGTKSDKKQSTTTTEVQKDSVRYCCQMHPDVKMDKPGKCPKCGKTLKKKAIKATGTKNDKKEVIKTYTCSMHPEVKSDKPGKCTKCGMDLIEKK